MKEKIHTDFLILGAGLAGTMMARILADHNPESKRIVVVDQRPTQNTKNHWALLRFRDLETARALGVGVEEIEVEKAVYWHGQLHYAADITMNNTYSLKAYGNLANRSLKHLGITKRYLPLSTPAPLNCEWGYTVKRIEPGLVTTEDAHGTECEIEYEICISTLPMSTLLWVTRGVEFPKVEWQSEPISVFRKKVNKIRCEVNQTIYFPESRFNIYRATLERGLFIIEYMDMGTESPIDEFEEVIGCFGLPFSRSLFDEVEPKDFHIQEYGKIVDMDDSLRREIIYQLTDQFNIYSVGRFATWRPLRADQLVKDVYKVERMIKQGQARTKYERRLNKGA
jgi:hypothetical protein